MRCRRDDLEKDRSSSVLDMTFPLSSILAEQDYWE